MFFAKSNDFTEKKYIARHFKFSFDTTAFAINFSHPFSAKNHNFSFGKHQQSLTNCSVSRGFLLFTWSQTKTNDLSFCVIFITTAEFDLPRAPVNSSSMQVNSSANTVGQLLSQSFSSKIVQYFLSSRSIRSQFLPGSWPLSVSVNHIFQWV